MSKGRGFTLIELMIVVAMIGLLVSLAMPRFTQYRMRTLRAEVRTNLAAILRNETAYLGEHGTYTDDLLQLKWSPSGSPRYLYGFTSNALPAASGRNDTAELRAAGHGGFNTARMLDAFGNPLSQGDLPASVVSKNHFRASAVANLDRDATLDEWIVDSSDNKIVLLKDDIEE